MNRAYFLHPHKSLDKIEREYKIKFSEEELNKLAELAIDLNLKELIAYIAELGQNKGIKGKDLGYFIYDVMRTCIFYAKAAEYIFVSPKEEKK